jgi:hypothetical protein
MWNLLPMPSPSNPANTNPAPATPRVHALVLLAWFMLGYTWLMGHSNWTFTLPFPFLGSPGGTRLSLLALVPFFKALPSHSLCVFQQWIGLPCVFCGMTRSFSLISQGQWLASLHYHLLGLPCYAATLLFAVSGVCSPQKADTAMRLFKEKRSLALLMLALLVCWVWKLSQDPFFW